MRTHYDKRKLIETCLSEAVKSLAQVAFRSCSTFRFVFTTESARAVRGISHSLNRVASFFLLPIALLLHVSGNQPFVVFRSVILVCILGVIGREIANLSQIDLKIDEIELGVPVYVVIGMGFVGVQTLVFANLPLPQQLKFALPALLLVRFVFVSRHRTCFRSISAHTTKSTYWVRISFWVAIFVLLGVSSFRFAILGFGVLILGACLGGVLRATRIAPHNAAATAVVVPLILVALAQLLSPDLRYSPWSYVLGSMDSHFWIAQSWVTVSDGWNLDPTIAGVDFPYHLLAQAIAGEMSIVSGLIPAAAVSVLVPTLSIAGTFSALAALLRRHVAESYVAVCVAAAVLASFSPLEPNNAWSTESFTHLVSMAFLSVTLLYVQVYLSERAIRQREGVGFIAFLVAVTALTKVFTGAIALLVLGVLALTLVFVQQIQLARRLAFALVMIVVALGVVSTVTYADAGSSTVYQLRLGFLSLDYRWGLVGGPDSGELVQVFMLVLLFLPFLLALSHVITLFAVREKLDSDGGLAKSLIVSAVMLSIAAVITDWPPAGYAERYFSATALPLLVVGMSIHLGTVLSAGPPPHESKLCIVRASLILGSGVSLVATVMLWSERLQGWPSASRFVVLYTLPIAVGVVAVVCAAVVWFRFFWVGSLRIFGERVAAAWTLIIAVVSMGATAGYAIRGPGNTAVGVVAQRVEFGDFVTELKESRDPTEPYREMLQAIESSTNLSAIIASSMTTDAQLMIASVAKRRLWWSSYIGGLERTSSSLTNHIRWRGLLVSEFGATPSASAAALLASCGATHFVAEIGESGVANDFVFPGVSTLSYSNNDVVIVAFVDQRRDGIVPTKQLTRLCASNPSAR